MHFDVFNESIFTLLVFSATMNIRKILKNHSSVKQTSWNQSLSNAVVPMPRQVFDGDTVLAKTWRTFQSTWEKLFIHFARLFMHLILFAISAAAIKKKLYCLLLAPHLFGNTLVGLLFPIDTFMFTPFVLSSSQIHIIACSFQITRRGAAPEGGGEVTFSCPCKQKLRPLQFTDPGKIKRIRGIAYPWISIYMYTVISNNSLRVMLKKCMTYIIKL